jgi:hypothetical protein
MSGVIPILCPECGNAALTPRQPYDYPEAVRLEVLCGECAGGDFAESCYYDRADNHITRDPDDVLDSERGQ